MPELAAQSWFMLQRQGRNLLRERVWVALLLIQPLVWLVLYSQLFTRITELGGFGTDDYLDFFLPGVVCMNAFFAGSWSGMATVTDLDRGVIERFLATPVRRSALVFSQVARAATQAGIQGSILIAIGLAIGADIAGGVIGGVAILVAGMLLAAGFSGISHALALIFRREATMIAAANFIALPLMFLSAILIARPLMPGWMQAVSRFNPVDWGVRAAREPALPGTDWLVVASYLGLLAGFTLLTAGFATWAFRAYQRTL
ncbi:MAG: ABC transporter permease [Thermoleophilia bacterium]|nr:ABC transporter permease [Thermoleophilia bacterium]